MATIDITRKHGLGAEQAAERVRKLTEAFAAKSDMVQNVEWNGAGTSATASGQGFSARFDVHDDRVDVAVDLNMMLRPFKKKVREQLERRLDKALA